MIATRAVLRDLSRARADALAVVGLLAFTLVFYRQLTLGGRVLVSFDTLAYFYPLLTYLGEALRDSRIPLWNPDHFVGAPFLANPQTGVFYPSNWLTALVAAPVAYSWSVALHAAVAALGAYAFGRRALRLGSFGSLVTAVVFAFGGFFTAQAVHLNQMAAAAWLPWLVLATDSLVRRPRLPVALGGATALALAVLAGHSQVVYLSAWAVGIWGGLALLAGLRAERRRSADVKGIAGWLAPRLGALALLGGVGIALTAAQLVPTLELSREGIRSGGLTFDEASSFSFPPWKALVSLLPTFGRVGVFSEWVGYVGVAALTLAGIALVGVRDRRALALGTLVGVGLLFALGQYTPVYEAFYHLVPGFDMFRVPARWLLLYSFGLAGLAGVGLDALRPARSGTHATPERMASENVVGTPTVRWQSLLLRLAMLGAAVAVLLVAYHLTQRGFPLERAGVTVALVWFGVAHVVAAVGALCLARPRKAAVARPLIVALVAGELLAGSLSLDVNRVNLPEAATAPPPEVAFLQAQPGLHRVFGISETAYEVGEVDALRTRLAGTLTPDEVYDYLVALKHKETLTPNLSLVFGLASLDGYDGGVLPLRSYLDVKALFPTEGTNVPDGRLRLQLKRVPDARLLRWLNVRYVVQDRAGDLWQDGHYYDLAFGREAMPGRPIAISDLGSAPVSALGIVASVEAGALAPGEVAASLRIADGAGRALEVPLRFGAEVTAAGEPLRASRLDLPEGFAPTDLTLEYRPSDGRLRLSALTALGRMAELDRIVGLSPDYSLVHIGDTKVYEVREPTPRAYFAGGVRLVADDSAARELLSSPGFDLHRRAVVTTADWAGPAPSADLATGAAEIVSWQPERIVVRVRADGPGLLVLTDAVYPGWQATVNGADTSVVRTDLAFRGVPVGAGESLVVMTFEPRSLRTGLGISAGAGILGIVSLGIWLRQRRLS